MSKQKTTEIEIKILFKNKHKEAVITKGITYTEDFKLRFVVEYENGKQP